ncbi:hypothetical protein KC344_g237 [Hortaea werneckii]|nr:hypothetical protein KC344_g237 [Hortaea werneckii]
MSVVVFRLRTLTSRAETRVHPFNSARAGCKLADEEGKRRINGCVLRGTLTRGEEGSARTHVCVSDAKPQRGHASKFIRTIDYDLRQALGRLSRCRVEGLGAGAQMECGTGGAWVTAHGGRNGEESGRFRAGYDYTTAYEASPEDSGLIVVERRHLTASAPGRSPPTEVLAAHWTCISDALSAILVSNRLTKLLARRASCTITENAVFLVPRSNHGLPLPVKRLCCLECLWTRPPSPGGPPSASRCIFTAIYGSCLPSNRGVMKRRRASRVADDCILTNDPPLLCRPSVTIVGGPEALDTDGDDEDRSASSSAKLSDSPRISLHSLLPTTSGLGNARYVRKRWQLPRLHAQDQRGSMIINDESDCSKRSNRHSLPGQMEDTSLSLRKRSLLLPPSTSSIVKPCETWRMPIKLLSFIVLGVNILT